MRLVVDIDANNTDADIAHGLEVMARFVRLSSPVPGMSGNVVGREMAPIGTWEVTE